ncbi:hypothetical protein GCM10010394_54120 [Streptomyces crystallinus]|uniref:Uncharacterized protein n=1 Tax=Streptomyces crystallinus TaxID=68191 RepID=A0ABN1GR80_9ACTN
MPDVREVFGVGEAVLDCHGSAVLSLGGATPSVAVCRVGFTPPGTEADRLAENPTEPAVLDGAAPLAPAPIPSPYTSKPSP